MKPHLRPGIAQLAYLHVSDAYRGRGIGGSLGDDLEALARTAGATSMVVSATVHPDLIADGDGVAYTEVDIAAEPRLLGGGYYYNVHEGPSSQTENPEIACGDIEP